MVIVMKYRNIQTAVFIARPNRFIAEVEVDGKTETVHVKNTGRCRELLLPGSKVILEKPDNPERKTNNVSCDNGLIPSYVQYRSEIKTRVKNAV